MVALTLAPVAASAQTTTYEYDALGRLTKSATTVNGSPVNTAITYDAAGNRTNYNVSGASNSGSGPGASASSPTARRFIVVPLNGFTLIPVN